MKCWLATISVMAAGLALSAPAALGQSGDPDRIDRQLALGHAAAIESAWNRVAARIAVTDAGDVWEDEWDGVSDPPVGDWWLQAWFDRGLTARYCDGMLAVYADQDELKGVGRDQRAVQVAPVAYANERSGLHLVTRGSRIVTGTHGRQDGALPACMPVLSTEADRVALVSEVDDPRTTPVGLRWEEVDRTVNCPVATDTGSLTERRRIPVQVTAITNCPADEPDCADLREFVTGAPAWPQDCAARDTMLAATPPTLPAQAACTDWFRWRSTCRVTYAAAPAPADIPDSTITWEPGPVHSWTTSCSCPSGERGTCTQHWEQNTEIRVFLLRPGVPELRTRQPARGSAGRRRLVRTDENCTPMETGCEGDCGNGPDGDDGGSSSSGSGEESTAEDDSANEGFGGSSMGPPGSDGVSSDGTPGGDSGCFLTTAVIGQRGEADDGPTLTVLREFRDGYMTATPEGRRLVADYYRTAPGIVAAIPKGHSDWEWIAGRIDEAVEAIGAGDDERALAIYTGMVRRLADKWL